MQIDPDVPADPRTTRTVSETQLLAVCESQRNTMKGTDNDANGRTYRSLPLHWRRCALTRSEHMQQAHTWTSAIRNERARSDGLIPNLKHVMVGDRQTDGQADGKIHIERQIETDRRMDSQHCRYQGEGQKL